MHRFILTAALFSFALGLCFTNVTEACPPPKKDPAHERLTGKLVKVTEPRPCLPPLVYWEIETLKGKVKLIFTDHPKLIEMAKKLEGKPVRADGPMAISGLIVHDLAQLTRQ